jgi:hypothetical protein
MIDGKKLVEYAQEERTKLDPDNNEGDYGEYAAWTNLITRINHNCFTVKAVPLDDLLEWVEENSVQYHQYGIIDTDDLKEALTKMGGGIVMEIDTGWKERLLIVILSMIVGAWIGIMITLLTFHP